MRVNLGITLNDRVLERLDRNRGDFPRSRAIEQMIIEKMEISPSELAGHRNGE